MLIFLFMFEILLGMVTTFTTYMVENKFRYIEKSLKMYTNNKAYVTEECIAFIDCVVNRYKEYIDTFNETPDIDSIVKSHLAKEHIGRFSYVSVKNLATKVKYIMWGIIVLEILIPILNREGATFKTVIIVSISALLTISIDLYTIVRALDEHSEKLIVEISDYVVNVYPIQKENIKCKEIKEMKIMGNKIIMLDRTGNRTETKLTSVQEEKLKILTEKNKEMVQKDGKIKETTISAQDIAQLLERL